MEKYNLEPLSFQEALEINGGTAPAEQSTAYQWGYAIGHAIVKTALIFLPWV